MYEFRRLHTPSERSLRPCSAFQYGWSDLSAECRELVCNYNFGVVLVSCGSIYQSQVCTVVQTDGTEFIMKKVKIIAATVVVLVVLFCVGKVSGMIVLTNGDPNSVERELGTKAALLKEYTGVQIMGTMISHPVFYKPENLKVKQYHLPADGKLVDQIYRDLSQFPYDPSQSDPFRISEGANCQAISIVLKETLERNGIPARYVLDRGLEHMYVEADLNGSKIELDLVNKKFNVKEA